MEASDVPAPPPVEMTEMSVENGSTAVDPEAPVGPSLRSVSEPQAAEGEESGKSEFHRLWKAVTDNPFDFTSWTELLQYCEQEVCPEAPDL